jgi:putative membrane protein
VIIVFWCDHNMGWWGYAGMGTGMVIFLPGDRRTRQQPPSPEQILAARFARAEISEPEYRDHLAVLRDPVRR